MDLRANFHPIEDLSVYFPVNPGLSIIRLGNPRGTKGITHCTPCIHGYCLDIDYYKGPRILLEDTYLSYKPKVHKVVVPIEPQIVTLDALHNWHSWHRPIEVWKTIGWFFGLPLEPSNCVISTKTILNYLGVCVPNRVKHPETLYEYLVKQGGEDVAFR